MIDFITNFVAAYPWALIAIVLHLIVLGSVAYFILLERKVASWTQDRIGPNRVGPKGLLQPIADGLKMLLKEDYRPAGADKVLFSVAPVLIMLVAIVSIAVIPWGGMHQVTRSINVPAATDPAVAAREAVPGNATIISVSADTSPGKAVVTYRYPFQIARLNIGVLFIIAVLSLAVYGIVLGGWASNNKYSFLGGLRATAQMISYEVPLGLALLTIVVMFGTLDLGEIVAKQSHYWAGFFPAWNVFTQPVAFFIFLICIHAEANRMPFDLAEAEQELVGGYHTEYSAMRLGLLLLAEYAGMITTSAVCVALFFGGWHLPGLVGHVDPANPSVTSSLVVVLLRAGVFFGKTLVVIFVFMWVRWSLPRFRYDQLMNLAWRAMIPLSLAVLMATAVVVYLFADRRANMQIGGKMGLALLAMNVIIVAAVALVSRVLPAPPPTNRRIEVADSRFRKTPLPT